MIKNLSNKEIDEKLISFLGNELPDGEMEFVIRWIKQSDENRKYFNELKKTWISSAGNSNPYNVSKEENWDKITNRISTKNVTWKFTFLRIAAVFVLAFIFGSFTTWFIWNGFSTKSDIAYHEINVPLGSQSEITLPDGSKVWLNSGSKLRYPGIFVSDSRMVELEGEAFFDVITDKSKPFVVDAQGVLIKALGTQFNVKAYEDEDIVRTTLIEGVVTIKYEKYNQNEIYLKPNQIASIQKNGKDINLSELEESGDNETIIASNEGLVLKKLKDPSPVVSWKEEEWIIKNQSFEDLAKNLERRYDVSIDFKDMDLKKFRFTGTIKDESLEQVLEVIRLTTPLEYSVNGKVVEFKEDIANKELYRDLYNE